MNGVPDGTVHLVYDDHDHLLAETDPSGTVLREYVWLGDLPVAVLDGTQDPRTPTLLFVQADHLERPVLMAAADGTVVWRAAYDAFGAVREIAGPATLDLRFPGQWFQLETGWHYNWHRHYDPTTGRYATPDPLGLNQEPEPAGRGGDDGGWSDARLAAVAPSLTIASLSAGLWSDGLRVTRDGPNLYAYAGSNPLQRIDPKGLISGPVTPRSGVVGSGACEQDTFIKVADGSCHAEWETARARCLSYLLSPNPPRGITGGYADIENCARGLVSERCGGNPVRFRKN